MNQSIREKLETFTGRLAELDRMLASPEVIADQNEFRKLSCERAELSPLVALYQTWRQNEADLAAARELLGDPEMRDLAAAEIEAVKERLPELENELNKLLLPKDANDERNVFLEIRAGTGGDESALFAGNLFRMYSRYAERQRWQLEVIS
ncbi:MAG TPA: PCRF domain-containing protein, partial [Accumulibacter sp.]|nr:PCRF domain-containing protein [Accumulibacter sp.]